MIYSGFFFTHPAAEGRKVYVKWPGVNPRLSSWMDQYNKVYFTFKIDHLSFLAYQILRYKLHKKQKSVYVGLLYLHCMNRGVKVM